MINCAFYGTHSDYASFDARLAYWFFSKELGDKTTDEIGTYNHGIESDMMTPQREYVTEGEDAKTHLSSMSSNFELVTDPE